MKPLIERVELMQIAEKLQNDPQYKKDYEERVKDLEALIKANTYQLANQLAAVGFSAFYLDEAQGSHDDYEGIVAMDLTRIGFVSNQMPSEVDPEALARCLFSNNLDSDEVKWCEADRIIYTQYARMAIAFLVRRGLLGSNNQ